MITYTNHRLRGIACLIHEDFVPYMDIICAWLEKFDLWLSLNETGRKPGEDVQGAVFTPASMSNHYVFCALDGNLVDSTGTSWTNLMLANPSKNIQDFIDFICASGIRWGGHFHADRQGRIDRVHYDNGLNIHNPDRWHEIYNELYPAAS